MKKQTFACLLVLYSLLLGLPAFGQVSGEGSVVKKTLSLESFHSIGLGVSADVVLVKGNTQKVEIEGQQNIIDLLKKEVKNGSWNIGFPDGTRARNYERLKVYITMPEVRKLAIGGSGSIVSKDAFEGLGDLNFSIGGSGAIEFAGSARSLEISIGGSGSVKAKSLKVENCSISIGGSGNAYIECSESLNVSIGGAGSVYYAGRPKIKSSIAGSGRLESM